MIEINDTDLPITAAEKIITGRKQNNSSDAIKAISKAIIGKDQAEVDMFDLEEIKEISDYLMVYYNNHSNGD